MVDSGSDRPLNSKKKDDKSKIFKVHSQQLRELFRAEDLDKKTRRAKLDKLDGVPGIIKKIQSDAHSGIMGDIYDLRRRTRNYCKNQKPVPQKPPIWQSVKGALDMLLIIVAVFAVISIIPGMVVDAAQGWVEGVFILVALFVQVLISAYADYKKDNKFIQLQALNREETLPVLRGKRGMMQTLSVWELVSGDVIQLRPGDKVPADCLVIESVNLAVSEPEPRASSPDEPPMPIQYTAEQQVKDATNDPFLIADSYVTRGVCKALVCCVGEHSTRGIKDIPLNLEEKETELKRRLTNIGGSLKLFAIISSLVILGTSIVILIINKAAVEELGGDVFVNRLINCIIVALVMLIVAVPEGLDMTMDVSLAYSVLQMSSDDNVLVRDLEAVEEVGQITDLILGKTGTMTTEEMDVHSFFVQGDYKINTRLNTFQHCELDRDIQVKIIQSIVWNSSAYIEMSEDSFFVPKGQGTEVSLIKWLQNAEEPVHEYMKQKFSGIVRATVPFSNTLKKSIIAVQLPQNHGHDTVRVFVKGAPEVVIPNCAKHYQGAGDNPQKNNMEDHDKQQIMDIAHEKMTSQGARCLAFSYCDMATSDFETMMDNMHGEIDSPQEIAQLEGQEQTFLALVALKDPLRPNIKEVIKTANTSRINLILVSGDNLITSAAVAADTNMITKTEFEVIKNRGQTTLAMTGSEFAAAVGRVHERRVAGEEGEEDTIEYELENQDEFARIITDLKVIGRADPETKRRLVAGLKGLNKGEEDASKHRRIAVVGEGINDVKAFRTADVSFALQSGSSIARNNASMVLRTDDFDSVIKAVMWGRNIFMNIQRFLQFQITCNLSVIIVVLTSYCVRQETVLNPVQLIYINLIMDILGALALSSTKPTADIVNYQAGQGNIVTPFMYRQIFGCMLGMVGIMVVIMCANKKVFELNFSNHESTIENKDKMAAFTLMFNTFIFLQIFNLINCRDVSPKGKNGFAGLHKNFLTLIIIGILIAVQFAACFTFLGIPVFETSVRGEKNVEGGRHFAITVVSAATILLVNAMLKFIPSKWISKMPQLDENEPAGNNKLVAFYDGAARKNLGAAQQQQVLEESDFEGQSGSQQDGYDRV